MLSETSRDDSEHITARSPQAQIVDIWIQRWSRFYVITSVFIVLKILTWNHIISRGLLLPDMDPINQTRKHFMFKMIDADGFASLPSMLA